MSNENIEDTSPVVTPPISTETEQKPARKPKLWLVFVFGFLLIVLLSGLGGFTAYSLTVRDIRATSVGQVTFNATTQFQLGLQDIAAGRLEMAKSRFEYVIELDPKFPGAQEKLTEVMLQLAMVRTPTAAPSPTTAFTSTPDTRGEATIFNEAWQNFVNKKWDKTIESLDALRRTNLQYRAVDVDGMYYIALRFQGIQKIQMGSLEPGMYDLSLSETFAPLDREGVGYRNMAREYITGASFWKLDWPKVLSYFGEIYKTLPNLRDASGITAVERYRLASMLYGDQLYQQGQYCEARDQYNNSLSVGVDPKLVPTATQAQDKCEPPATKTPKPEDVTPADTQINNTPVPVDTVEPKATHTPTDTKEAPAPSATPEPPTKEPPTKEPPTATTGK